jgi:hypothetical protein
MSKRLTLLISDGLIRVPKRSRTRIPDSGAIPPDWVKEVALGLFNDLQHMTLDECVCWVDGLRIRQEDVGYGEEESKKRGEGTPASREADSEEEA